MSANPEEQKILIIEDNPGDFFLITEFLKRTTLPKYQIYHAEKLAEAEELLQQEEFKLILMDLFLPDSEGIQTFKKILPLSAHTPVIVLTGLVNEEVTSNALKQGAQDYLVKGEYDEKLLEKTIRYAIERKHNQELIIRSEERARNKLEVLVRERTRELEEAIKKEKQLVELKNQFVAIASHEFRTPLSTIRFAADYLHDYLERLDKEEIKIKLKKIEKQVVYMSALLEDVITAGRTELNKIPVLKSSIELKSLVDKILEEVLHSTKKTHRIEVIASYSNELITTDEKLLRNILINLLNNAIKFSPGKEYITFKVIHDKKSLLMEVIDQGIGISKEDIPKLFQAFHRGSNTSTIAGTGLGLSIVKKAVELLRGEITVDSEINVGTSIRVVFPLED
ncbi:MAG: response regulator [Cytophagia bacterium]|nr:response regulator [Cytophagia bacterium]NBW34476.1 response regulator [Cytophagia bacterium]